MRTLSLLVFVAFLGSSGYSQHFIRTNTLGYLYGNPGMAYEHVIQSRLGLGLEANFNLFQWTNEDINGEYRGRRLTPEVRLYFRKQDSATTKVFNPYLGLYWQNRKEEYDDTWTYMVNDSTTANRATTTTLRSDAIGATFGAKLIFQGSFYMDIGLGFGPYLNFEERKINPFGGEDTILKDIKYEKADLRRIHMRVLAAIGFRF